MFWNILDIISSILRLFSLLPDKQDDEGTEHFKK